MARNVRIEGEEYEAISNNMLALTTLMDDWMFLVNNLDQIPLEILNHGISSISLQFKSILWTIDAIKKRSTFVEQESYTPA